MRGSEGSGSWEDERVFSPLFFLPCPEFHIAFSGNTSRPLEFNKGRILSFLFSLFSLPFSLTFSYTFMVIIYPEFFT